MEPDQSGRHPGCDYIATGYCIRCGWIPNEVERLRFMVRTLEQKAVENYDMRQALLRIARQDFRGPEPEHVRIAREALEEAGR